MIHPWFYAHTRTNPDDTVVSRLWWGWWSWQKSVWNELSPRQMDAKIKYLTRCFTLLLSQFAIKSFFFQFRIREVYTLQLLNDIICRIHFSPPLSWSIKSDIRVIKARIFIKSIIPPIAWCLSVSLAISFHFPPHPAQSFFLYWLSWVSSAAYHLSSSRLILCGCLSLRVSREPSILFQWMRLDDHAAITMSTLLFFSPLCRSCIDVVENCLISAVGQCSLKTSGYGWLSNNKKTLWLFENYSIDFLLWLKCLCLVHHAYRQTTSFHNWWCGDHFGVWVQTWKMWKEIYRYTFLLSPLSCFFVISVYMDSTILDV